MEGDTLKWLELIRVRSSVATLEGAAPALRRNVNELGGSVPDAEILFLRHGLYDGDLAIAIVWRTRETPKRTQLGAVLASELQTLGSVDHAVWIPTSEPAKAEGEP